MLSGTTGIADIFALLLWQMIWAITEIAAGLLLVVLASSFIMRSFRLHQSHGHGALLPWFYDHLIHGHDPRPWLRRRSRRAVRRLAVSRVKQMRRLEAIVRG
jgi:hypothetical protein